MIDARNTEFSSRSERAGKPYRLLSQAEWESTARAVTDPTRPSTKYSWGNDIGTTTTNGGTSFGCKSCGQNPVPVRQFPANAFGLHDMHGNVWERVADCFVANKPAAIAGTDQAANSCTTHVLRGGAFRRRQEITATFGAWVRVKKIGRHGRPGS